QLTGPHGREPQIPFGEGEQDLLDAFDGGCGDGQGDVVAGVVLAGAEAPECVGEGECALALDGGKEGAVGAGRGGGGG
ncbi:hypothetical protein AB1285_27260, partial [Microbacterium sp. NRRL B-14842]|uniref:hypothetical protein n=1 Tax=Microbacterium sp. NRRL B-14842 TaxID=3162881 RepID=UPI003D29D91C